ncbi:T-lymphocyte activation antigen CD86-like [Hyperolius riggenbachi]|uniref:T-lymphocyte activation antigen CD86-like n=1 Tax=Hyperolius riggenbachi TaxID=752182 RepID=UPI0035A327ED
MASFFLQKNLGPLSVLILSIVLSVNAQETCHGKALVHGMAKLQCNYHFPNNTAKKSMSVYWQKKRNPTDKDYLEVVYAIYLGEDKTDTINKKYQERSFLEQNWDLRINNITSGDVGEYTCIVFINNRKVYDSFFKLDVFANYSKPKFDHGLSSVMTVKRGDYVDLNCTSGNGFPKPQDMYWELSNGSQPVRKLASFQIQNSSETYTIFSTLSLKVEYNISIRCILVAHHTVASEFQQVIILEDVPPVSHDYNLYIIISAVMLVLITVLAVILIVWRQNKSETVRRRNPNVEMGRRRNGSSRDNHQDQHETLMTPEQVTANGSS